jgi:hypothetical protein
VIRIEPAIAICSIRAGWHTARNTSSPLESQNHSSGSASAPSVAVTTPLLRPHGLGVGGGCGTMGNGWLVSIPGTDPGQGPFPMFR